jgi:hypothetical protein
MNWKYHCLYGIQMNITKYTVQKLATNKHSKIMSTNTFHTILDLANISYPNENLSLSFSNDKFDSLSQRLFYRTNKTILKLNSYD